MALATTCTKCNTSFRVAPEQLASRRGMVRCGVCQNVFSGMANLRHVDEILRPARSAAQGGAAGAAADQRASAAAKADARRGDEPEQRRGQRGRDFEQTDLRTAFFLPETVFGPSTEMVAQGQQFISEPTAMPASLQKGSKPSESGLFTDDDAPGQGAMAAGDGERRTDDDRLGDLSGSLTGDVRDDVRDEMRDEMRHEMRHDLRGDMPDDGARSGGPGGLADNDERTDGSGGAHDSGSASEDSATIGLRQPTPKTRFRWAQENEEAAPRADGLEGSASTPASTPAARADLPDGAAVPEVARDARRRRSGGDIASGKKRPSRQRSGKRDRSDEAIAYFATEESAGGFTSRAVAFGWIGCAFALLLLAVQLVIGGRNAIASQFPALRAPLAALVSPLGIKVEPPRDLQALTIESFELQAAGTQGLYSVSALLRNHSSRAVHWPALEMTLTDGQGTLLVRKVLLPADYMPGLPPELAKDAERGVSQRAEVPLKLALEARDLVPTNYSVTLFYP